MICPHWVACLAIRHRLAGATRDTSVLVAVSSRRESVWPLTRFASRKWRSGLNGISHPDWVKFSVELNSAPKQNTRFSSSLHYYTTVLGRAPLLSLDCFLETYLIMQSVKQGGIKYHFFSLWYDSTWDWTPVSLAIGEHSTTKPMGWLGHVCIFFSILFVCISRIYQMLSGCILLFVEC